MSDQRFAPPRLQNDDGTVWPTIDHPSQGEIGGSRHYEGKAPSIGPWKCPACRTENTGPLEQGCTSCGAGAPGRHVGVDPPPPPLDDWKRGPTLPPLPNAPQPSTLDRISDLMAAGLDVQDAARAWEAAHEDAPLSAAFIAGYAFAMARTMRTQAPVTIDRPLATPAGKSARTIIAALKLFRDQVLAQSPDEIADGEWCSIEEVDELIAQLEAQELQ